MRDGIRNLKSHLIREDFNIEAERNAAGRAALVAELVRHKKTDFNLPRFLSQEPDQEYLKQSKLTGDWKFLQSLRNTQAQAFACWATAQSFQGEQ
jgi:hypothetical protein